MNGLIVAEVTVYIVFALLELYDFVWRRHPAGYELTPNCSRAFET